MNPKPVAREVYEQFIRPDICGGSRVLAGIHFQGGGSYPASDACINEDKIT
jgi:hypothetical protein